MKSKPKSISKVLIWQIITQILLTGIATLTTPIFTRLLSKAEYGAFTNFSSWVAVVGVILSLQTAGSIANAKSRYEKRDYPKYLSSILVLTSVGFIVAIIASILCRHLFGSLFKVDERIVPLVFVISFFSYVISFYERVLSLELSVEKNAVIALLKSVGTLLLSLLFVNIMPVDKYFGRVYGMLVPLAVISVYEMSDIMRRGRRVYDKEYWKYCLKLTTPLIFHALAGMVLSLSDRIMLTRMKGEESTAVYGVAYSLGNILNTIWVAFNNTWVPFYYQYKKEQNSEEINRKLKNYTLVYSIISVGFLLCTPEVFKLFAPSTYWDGLSIIPPIVMGYYFNFMYSIFGNFEFYHEKTRMISVGTTICAIGNIILNILLIPIMGELGAAIATVGAYALLYVFHYIISKKVLKIECEIKNHFLVIGMIIVAAFSVGFYFTLEYTVIRWIVAVLLGCILIRRIIVRKSIL